MNGNDLINSLIVTIKMYELIVLGNICCNADHSYSNPNLLIYNPYIINYNLCFINKKQSITSISASVV